MARLGLLLAWGLAFFPTAGHSADIHTAAESGDLARVRSLLADEPEEISATDEDGNSPLHWAAAGGYRDLVAWLLDQGAEINARNHKCETPLFQAVRELQYGAAELLIDRGADLELPDEYGRTPLLRTAWGSGDLRMLRQLLERGAAVDARDRGGATSLNLAAWRGFGSAINVLLEHGASVEVAGHAGRMLFSEALGRGLPRLYERLVADGIAIPIAGAEGGMLVRRAAAGGSAEIVADLIRRGADAEFVDYYGWTPLHYAAARRRPAVATELLRHIEDPNRRTRSGYSALNLACEKGAAETARILLNHGVNDAPRAFPTLTGPYFGQASPGGRPMPFALDIVATPYDQHSNITFSPDGREAYWSGTFDIPDSGFMQSTILCSREVAGRWTSPEIAPFVVAGHNHDVPFFAPSGRKLYFLSTRPLAPGEQDEEEHVWVVARQGDGWGEPKPLPRVINRYRHHWQVSVASNGNLYFHSRTTTAETQGIFLSRFVDGQYREPEFLGIHEMMPYIAPDESYLITFEFGEPAERNLIRFRMPAGEWGPPIDLTAATEGRVLGTCPIMSPDERHLFFVWSVYENDNTWWISADFMESLRNSQPG